MGIDPLPNNGTLRLPLKPVGLHSDENTPPLERPADPPEQPSTATTPPEPTSPASEAPDESSTEDSDREDEKVSTWWGPLHDKFEEWKHWTSDLFSSLKDNHPQQQ
jgi:hypothetical protein